MSNKRDSLAELRERRMVSARAAAAADHVVPLVGENKIPCTSFYSKPVVSSLAPNTVIIASPSSTAKRRPKSGGERTPLEEVLINIPSMRKAVTPIPSMRSSYPLFSTPTKRDYENPDSLKSRAPTEKPRTSHNLPDQWKPERSERRLSASEAVAASLVELEGVPFSGWRSINSQLELGSPASNIAQEIGPSTPEKSDLSPQIVSDPSVRSSVCVKVLARIFGSQNGLDGHPVSSPMKPSSSAHSSALIPAGRTSCYPALPIGSFSSPPRQRLSDQRRLTPQTLSGIFGSRTVEKSEVAVQTEDILSRAEISVFSCERVNSSAISAITARLPDLSSTGSVEKRRRLNGGRGFVQETVEERQFVVEVSQDSRVDTTKRTPKK